MNSHEKYKLLLVDDVPKDDVAALASQYHFDVKQCPDESVLDPILACDDCQYDLAMVDFMLKDAFPTRFYNGMGVIKALRDRFPHLELIGVSKWLGENPGWQDYSNLVAEWLQAGATWYLDFKNLQTEGNWKQIAPILWELAARTKRRRDWRTRSGFGAEPTMPSDIRDRAARAGIRGARVLIEGEPGVGKELLARFIADQASLRLSDEAQSTFEFVPVNCAAIPATLFESEMFGHVKGAFTGAEERVGLFEQASGGALFLDEIGELDLPCQARLLRALETGMIKKVGDSREIQARPVIVISATNANLKEKVAEKKFRRDLYWRLNVMSLRMSPLRERSNEIPTLVDQLLARANYEHGTNVSFVDRDSAVEIFKSHFMNQIPEESGNIRELFNLLIRVVCNSKSDKVNSEEIEALFSDQTVTNITPPKLGKKVMIQDRTTWHAKVAEVIETLIPQFDDPSSPIKSTTALLEEAIKNVGQEYDVQEELLASGRTRKTALGPKALNKYLAAHNPTLLQKIKGKSPWGTGGP